MCSSKGRLSVPWHNGTMPVRACFEIYRASRGRRALRLRGANEGFATIPAFTPLLRTSAENSTRARN